LGGTGTDSTQNDRDTSRGICVLHPVGSAGHVVHSSVFGCKTSTHYFSCSGGSMHFL
jgi:hypothetical protein